MTTDRGLLHRLSNTQLISSLEQLVQQHRATTADMLAHLIEVERRELHLAAACSSMFAYCTDVLGLSDGEAADRIFAARAARRFPIVLDMLAAEKLHLTALRLLAPHLDDDNHLHLLQAAVGKTKRDIKLMLAELAPKPDVPARIRKRPRPRPAIPATAPDLDLFETRPQTAEPATRAADTRQSQPDPKPEPPTRRSQPGPKPEPLGAGRYKVEFTASEALVTRIRQCMGLMGHTNGELTDVFEQAVGLLHAKLVKDRFGVGAKPRRRSGAKHRRRAGRQQAPGASPPTAATSRSRRVPNDVKREVVERDGLRCAYVDTDTGRRCSERKRLQLQHHQPFARGGEHSAENVSLYCAAHNAWAARRDFGSAFIDNAIAAARTAGSRQHGPAHAAGGGQQLTLAAPDAAEGLAGEPADDTTGKHRSERPGALGVYAGAPPA